jgi:hypothetical protein
LINDKPFTNSLIFLTHPPSFKYDLDQSDEYVNDTDSEE